MLTHIHTQRAHTHMSNTSQLATTATVRYILVPRYAHIGLNVYSHEKESNKRNDKWNRAYGWTACYGELPPPFIWLRRFIKFVSEPMDAQPSTYTTQLAMCGCMRADFFYAFHTPVCGVCMRVCAVCYRYTRSQCVRYWIQSHTINLYPFCIECSRYSIATMLAVRMVGGCFLSFVHFVRHNS